ncbi:helix-turn-helix domain-containing protein [Arthrobacter sp. SDTb3-6]|uniref:helix-turn-helix domain-containing protein n=1 Tax=Arthrobacter sp. SDTb3-6 TaxID=2713571 RepID=UPI00159E50E9|nr:helix-turn-helix domain-containing protein [Arthrobacter sp. SDTb3-6]NVM97763.1 helix-turn-helix domain-containing protein [Arthrobacter sp. SDTb3-6]
MTTKPGSDPAPFEPASWMSPQDVCNQLHIPRQTFYQWRAKRLGPPAYKFGKLIRVKRDDFNEWMASHAEITGRTPANPHGADEIR